MLDSSHIIPCHSVSCLFHWQHQFCSCFIMERDPCASLLSMNWQDAKPRVFFCLNGDIRYCHQPIVLPSSPPPPLITYILAYIHMHTYIHVHMHTVSYTRSHTHTHTYSHTHSHTHIHNSDSVSDHVDKMVFETNMLTPEETMNTGKYCPISTQVSGPLNLPKYGF